METTKTKIQTNVIAERIEGSVASAARDLGISKQHLHNILKGRKTPSVDLLFKIQKHFNIPLTSLYKNK